MRDLIFYLVFLFLGFAVGRINLPKVDTRITWQLACIDGQIAALEAQFKGAGPMKTCEEMWEVKLKESK